MEVNLKDLINKFWEYKFLFMLSIGASVAIAIVYIKLETPIYEVSSSILIDVSGKNRILGNESKYLDGGVNLMEVENNLFNEIGVLKSFSLVRQTVEDLNFNVSYYVGDWIKKNEKYGYFPFQVILTEQAPQIFNVPFKVEIISKEKFILIVESKEFIISNPATNSNRKIEKDLSYSGEYLFGELIEHDYFSFKLELPDYKVGMDEFKDLTLSFILHDYDRLANNYIRKLDVDNIDIKASILKIRSQGAIIDKEIDFLTKLTENYIENKLIARNNIATIKESFIRKQLTGVSDSLAKAELNLEAYKKNEKALNLGASASLALDQSQKLQSEKAKIEFNIKYYNSIVKYLKDNLGSGKMVAPSALGIEDAILNANLVELQRLYSEKVRKELFVTSDNQELEILDSQINKATELLLENLKNLIHSYELALEETDTQLSFYKAKIGALPMRELQLLNIQRKSTLYENLFNYLSQELAKTGIARAESTTDTRVLDQARMVGNGPVSPKKMLLLVLAVIISFIIPLMWIVFFNSSDDTIQNLSQIEKNTNLEVLASITHSNSKMGSSVSDISAWRAEESFRDLSANLHFVIQKKRNLVIGITSSIPDEGKTFCAINLGIKLAEAGEKILIIETDLRNPSLFNDIEGVKGNGLSNYLEGDVSSVNSIIRTHEKLKNLEFIPSQVLDGNIQELLSGAKMHSLVQDLKYYYDFIILDAPAVGIVSDYLLVMSIIDINLFVIRRKVSKISYIDDFEKLLSRGNMQNGYIIFNDAEGKENIYGYSKKYGETRKSFPISKSLST